MCQHCAQQVKEMDIRDSDLPNLPYTEVYQYCIVPGCKGRCNMRDYGQPDMYYWPVKVRYMPRGFRGGWCHATHAYRCSKHWKLIKKRLMEIPEHDEATCLSRIVPIEKKKPSRRF